MSMIQAYRNAKNPQQLLNNIIQRNPQVQAVVNLINQSGGDARSIFYSMARQKGVNPDEFLKSIFG